MDRVPRIPSRLSTLFPERVIRSHNSEGTFPFSLEETKRERERERQRWQQRVRKSRPRTGPDFISCAFVFRSDYSRGHKRKIRYVQDTHHYVKDPVTYGGRTRIRLSLSLSWSPLPDPLRHPILLAHWTSNHDLSLLVSGGDELLTIGRKFTRIRRFRKSGSSIDQRAGRASTRPINNRRI